MRTLNLIAPVFVYEDFYDPDIVAVIEISSELAEKLLRIMHYLKEFEEKFGVRVLHIRISGHANFYPVKELPEDLVFKSTDRMKFNAILRSLDDDEELRTEIDSIKIWQD